jgi:hypothetical protein
VSARKQGATKKRLGRAELDRRVARQVVWAIVDVFTSRRVARNRTLAGETIRRLDVRVKGVRA